MIKIRLLYFIAIFLIITLIISFMIYLNYFHYNNDIIKTILSNTYNSYHRNNSNMSTPSIAIGTSAIRNDNRHSSAGRYEVIVTNNNNKLNEDTSDSDKNSNKISYSNNNDNISNEKDNSRNNNNSNDINIMDKIKSLYEIGINNPKLLLLKLSSNVLNTENFQCPKNNNNLIDNSMMYNTTAIQAFKDTATNDNNNNSKEYSFIFYQHLRKAGGTGFCKLAESNMLKKYIPPYYCMPDNRGSFATPPWDNPDYLLSNIIKHNYRIVSNEWDVFLTRFFDDYPNAVFGTTFRHPVERWYSQYRFEHLEYRDGSKKGSKRLAMLQWYKSQRGPTMGANYYIKTFYGVEDTVNKPKKRTGDFYWTYHKYHKKLITWDMFNTAIITIRRFQLILIMDWLSNSTNVINTILNWKIPPKQVLPHEIQAKRNKKISNSAKNLMSLDDYTELCVDNVFDILYYEVVKRLYLERSYQCYNK